MTLSRVTLARMLAALTAGTMSSAFTTANERSGKPFVLLPSTTTAAPGK
jgi:hypothetical protein